VLEIIEGEEPIELLVTNEEDAKMPEVERKILVLVNFQYL
jgi:hypothetical protein